jgi:hypothetical protein
VDRLHSDAQRALLHGWRLHPDTTFREFWAGHGYSLPQETASTLTIDEVRGGLMYAAVDEVRTAPLRDR